MNRNNISIICGRPYNPHSQGVIERTHWTIRNCLISKYLEDVKNFKLESVLKDIINTLNKTIHCKTKFSPFDIFYSEDTNFLDQVRENILKAFKNYNSELIDIKKNDNVLIFNNFTCKYVKKENLYYLNKSIIKKKGVLYNICGTVINVESNYLFKVVVEKDYKQYDLFKSDVCLIPSVKLKKGWF